MENTDKFVPNLEPKKMLWSLPKQLLDSCRDQDSNLGYFGHNEGY